ncbi:MAG: AI-2E family transporter [Saprospiraceae bacterium]|nr:AI-2E family transporter [Saprospiraceae bacterium]
MNKWWITLKQGRTIALIASLVFIGLIIYFFTDIVTYILLAWVISMVGAPLMSLMRKIRIKGWVPNASLRAAITIMVFFGILGGLGWLFIPMLLEQAASISQVNYVAIAQSLEEPLNRLNERLAELGLVHDTRSPSEQVIATLKTWFEPAKVGGFFTSSLSLAGTLIIGLFSVIFIAFFFLREEGLFMDFVSSLVPQEYNERTRRVIDDVSELLTRYFGGVLIQITLITLLLTIFLTLVGVNNAFLIAFFAALINVIPYIGFVQLLDNFIFQPFILGSRVLAHPLEIFIIVMVGAKIGGITGMVLAIPTYTVLRVIARVFLSEFTIVKKLTRRMEEAENGASTG